MKLNNRFTLTTGKVNLIRACVKQAFLSTTLPYSWRSIIAEHKHAAVLRAIADGKEAQFKSQHAIGWVEYRDNLHINPLSHPHLEWRIKPEPKPDWSVPLCVARIEGGGFYLSEKLPDNIKLIFDGETGNLKSAEVLP